MRWFPVLLGLVVLLIAPYGGAGARVLQAEGAAAGGDTGGPPPPRPSTANCSELFYEEQQVDHFNYQASAAVLTCSCPLLRALLLAGTASVRQPRPAATPPAPPSPLPAVQTNNVSGKPTWRQRYFLCDQYWDREDPYAPIFFYGGCWVQPTPPYAPPPARLPLCLPACLPAFQPCAPPAAPSHAPTCAREAGNEGNVANGVNNTGLMWERAQAFGALLVFAEVRRAQSSGAAAC